jgi:cell division initiation protein
MIDLTPLDVRKKRGDFRRLLRGYDPEEVDTFMDLVAERFEELVRENLALREKTGRIESQLQALEGRENAVQEALVTAQKLREDVGNQTRRDAEVLQTQASREAELLKAEAETEIARRLGDAEGLIHERQRALEELERSRLKFLKSFRGLLERELDAVEVEETRRPLEDIPLDLELRGWAPGGGLEEEPGEGDADEEEGFEAELDAEEVEVAADEMELMVGELEAAVEEGVIEEEEEGIPDGFKTQVLEGAAPAGLSVMPEEGVRPGAETDSETDLMGELEAGIGPEAFEGSPSFADVEEETAFSEEKELSSSGHEPKWLFSLLKKEEEDRGGEA